MKEFELKDRYDLEDYCRLMAFLRSPDGCPWDREQTHESIRRNMLEEAYELVHAIDTGDKENLREELGDVLMQVLFHAQIEAEAGGFDLDDVADAACKKLVYRHPHVFGGSAASTSGEVLETWERAKRAEKGQKTVTQSLAAVAENLPALWRCEKILKKAAGAGLELGDCARGLDKLREETQELAEGIEAGDADNIAEEVGDVLFNAVNLARLNGIDPEKALHAACEKFMRRFAYIESKAAETGRKIENLDVNEQKSLYQEARNVLEGKKKQF